MRKHALLLTLLMVCLPAGSLLAGSDYYDYSYARMSYVKGDVFIQRAEDLGYEEGVVNLALIEGDKIGTRDGRTEIHLGKRNYLRINHYTQIDIVGLPDEYEYRAQLHLLSGEIFLRVNYLERERDIEIHTPDGSYYIMENGLYRFMVRDNRETELRVLNGAVEAAAEEGSLMIYAEESLKTADGRFLNEPEPLRAAWNDAFYEWNQSREALHAYRVDRHYLPHELHDYESELAYYGNWVHEGSFGYVWVPRVRRSHWRPYWNGRWVWYPVIGWNWVSYEPWGWCVSHYGRWHWSVRLGWYWIPTRTWGPAWVHWYSGSHYVGWSPLSYWGYPGVVINNHYYGRYYHDSYPFNSRALTMVHKDQLQSRHISRVALDKSRISRVSKISLSSRQPDVRPAVNRDRVRTQVAAQALNRSKIRTVDKSFSGVRSSSIRSRADSSRIRKSSGTAESAGADRSRISRSGITRRNISSPSREKGSRASRAGTGAADRGRIVRSRPSSGKSARIKKYPSRNNSGTSRESRSIRSRASTRRSSVRSGKRDSELSRNSSIRERSSRVSDSGRIKRYSSRSRTSGKRESRSSAVTSRKRRETAVSSRARTYPSSRTFLNQRRSSRYITGRSSSSARSRSSVSSRRNPSSRSSSYIRKRSSSRSYSVKPRSSSRSSISRRSSPRVRSSSRPSVSRSRSSSRGSVSRSSRSGSSTRARRSSSRSSSGKKRKK